MEEICKNCQYYKHFPAYSWFENICCRFPPYANKKYSVVDGEGWCGEFKPKTEKEN